MSSRLARAGLLLMLVASLARPAYGQLPADARFHTIDSRNFRTTYPDGLEDLARHAAATAERAHAALSVMVARPPRGRIDLVLADNLDLSNGYATPVPTNRIVVFAKPPVDVLELQHMRDWIELVVTHELAHIFHLDVTGPVGRVLRTLFGRVPAPWPFFPALGTPIWSIEGLAVGVESAVTDLGRVHGSYNEMVARTAMLAGRFDEIERLGSTSSRWPGGPRVYIYGSLFMDYLARRFGPDVTARIVRSTAGAIIPPPLWFGAVGRDALGITFRQAYLDWQRELAESYAELAGSLRAQGLTTGEPLTRHRDYALHPRWSPDGRSIAYAAHDWRLPPHTRVIDAATGREIRASRRNVLGAVAWSPAGRIVTGDVEFRDRFRIYSDLREVGPGGRGRITRAARLQDPDVSRGGRIVAVQNEGGTNRLVLVADGGAVRALTDYDPDVHWALPRFSPDGARIAASRWRKGGVYDIVVIDTLGQPALALTEGAQIAMAPAWSPDGRWIVFSSDRTGIPNLYAVESQPGGALRQITNVLTGAFHPDVSPDGRWLIYAAYAHDGFVIERMSFDPDSWRDPQPTGPPTHVHAARHEGQHAAAAGTFAAAVDAAFSAADTTIGEPRDYRALPSLLPRFWLPTIEQRATDDLFLGAWSFGRDLVDRHEWVGHAAVDARSGRTMGSFSWTFRGISARLPGGLHPTLGASVSRDWDVFLPRNAPGDAYIDEREDIGAISLGVSHQRWRSSAALSIAVELIRRSRYLHDAPGFELADPDDDLRGFRAGASLARFVSPPRAISREAGFLLSAFARDRTDRNITTTVIDGELRTFDASYRELTSWNAAYIALPLPGFARHVLGVRFSGLLRDGPGAGRSSIGGAAAGGIAIPGLAPALGGASLLLPVRGFPRGVRSGTQAWTASLEYRAPIALIDAPLRPLPIFLDRVSGAMFVDSGHAWCDTATAARLPPAFCPSTSATDPPLLAVGAEITTLLSIAGVGVPLRFGVGVPLRYDDVRSARFYLLTGPSF